MGTVADVLAIVLVVLMAGSALGKLTGQADVVEALTRVGVPRALFPVLAAVQLVGAAALAYGAVAEGWVALTAAYGFVVYFLLAVLAHVRADDRRGLPLPLGLTVAFFVAALLRAA